MTAAVFFPHTNFPLQARHMGGFSLWHWLVVLLVVVLIFGTRRLGNTGKDLGTSIKEFKKAMREDEPAPPAQDKDKDAAASKPNDDDDRNPPVVR